MTFGLSGRLWARLCWNLQNNLETPVNSRVSFFVKFNFNFILTFFDLMHIIIISKFIDLRCRHGKLFGIHKSVQGAGGSQKSHDCRYALLRGALRLQDFRKIWEGIYPTYWYKHTTPRPHLVILFYVIDTTF